jgi:hypothetical protein
MRIFLIVAAIFALCLSAGAAGTHISVDTRDIQDHPFSSDFASGGRLRMYLRSGDFRITGTDENKITVKVTGRNAYDAGDMRLQLTGTDQSADLTITDGPKNDLSVAIEVPRKTGIFVRMTAGNLELHEVTGDKDAELHFGELIIDIGNSKDYSSVEASVYSGGLEASPFNEWHGGLFRSFHKEGNGKYYLRAHVGAGDLTLR